MEWLKKNGYTETVNKELVKANPFIPYALIMTQKDIMRLKQSELRLYTQAPIPIVKREALEAINKSPEVVSLQEFDKVSFWVSFNEGLLNEETLNQMMKRQEEKIQAMQQSLEKKQEEIIFYEEKRNQVAYSPLNKKEHDGVQSKVQELHLTQEKGQADYDQCKMMLKQLKTSLSNLQKSLQDVEKQFLQNKIQLEDLKALANAYALYIESKEELFQVEKALQVLEKAIDQEKSQRDALYREEQELRKESLNINNTLDKIKEQLTQYSMYVIGEQVEKDIEDIEAEYKSITESISLDQRNLETLLKEAKERFKQQEEELIEKAKEYALEEENYRNIVYDRFEERQQKEQVKKLEVDAKALMKRFAELKEKNGEIKNTLQSLESKLTKTYHKELRPREELVEVDFEEQIATQEIELKVLFQNKQQLEKEKNVFEVQYSGLDGFVERDERVAISFDKENIEVIKKEMLRDYQQSIKACNDKHKELNQVISELQRKEAFEDESLRNHL